jgi:hypothetical protein
MSNLSSLSREYWVGSELLSELNENVFVLRKAFWKLGGRNAVRREEVAESRGRLWKILERVRATREHGPVVRASVSMLEGSDAITVHLRNSSARQESRASEDSWADALDALARRLQQEEVVLSAEDFRLLDEISGSIADECARVYSELSRR